MAPRCAADDDWNDDAEDDVMPCPYCGREIHEDSVRCPYCESYLSAEDRLGRLKPLWFVLAAIVCLLVVLMWIFGGFVP
jgi:predicted nucleic acid-binding Zn ribbon protein